MKHGTSGVYNGTILLFNNTILLKSICSSSLPLNASFPTIVIEFIWLILGSIIGSSISWSSSLFDFPPRLWRHRTMRIFHPSSLRNISKFCERSHPWRQHNINILLMMSQATYQIDQNKPIAKWVLVLLSVEGNGPLVCFPLAHPWHTPSCSILNSGIPVTIFLASSRGLWWRWANVWCHSSDWSDVLQDMVPSGLPPIWYKLSTLNPRVNASLKFLFHPRTFPSMNATLNPLSSIAEIDTRFFFRSGTYSTSWRWMLLCWFNWRVTFPTVFTG